MDDISAQQASTGAAPWALLGRDTAAGRALFSLYNSENVHGRAAGLHYSQRNRQQMSSKPATPLANEEVAKKVKPKVAVPHFKSSQGPTSPNGGVMKLAHIPKRRHAEQIMAVMAAEAEQAWRAPVPMPSGPLLDAQEKERCALLMQYRGNIPCSQLTASSRAKGGPQHACKHAELQQDGDGLCSRRRLLQDRFHELAAGVQEREQFVSSMQQLGKLQPDHANIVQGEVAAKIKEMGNIDNHIKEIDKHLRQGSSGHDG